MNERLNISATVKWFNPAKGFGFVQVSPDEPDVFIHVTALAATNVEDLPPGTTLQCDVSRTDRGLQVSAVHDVDLSTAEESAAGGGRARRGGHDRRYGDADYSRPPTKDQETSGEVKFYDYNRGFGFVMPDDGGSDIFLPGRVLSKFGLDRLDAGQRIRVRWREGDRGRHAVFVELI